jgi:hypothetical protein
MDTMLTEMYRKLFNAEAKLDKLDSDMSGLARSQLNDSDKMALFATLSAERGLLRELISIRTDQIKSGDAY